jgi:hypothetical protein
MLCPYVRRASAKTSFELMPQQPASSLSTVSVNRTAWGRTRCKIDLGLESLLSVKRQRRDSKLIEAPTSSMGTVRLQVMGKSTMRSWLMDLSPVNRVRLRSPLMRWQMESSWLWYPRQQFTGTPVVSFAEDIWQALGPLQSSGQLWSCSCHFC